MTKPTKKAGEQPKDDCWVRSTQAAKDKLQKLVDEVLEADRRGECEPLDVDRLKSPH